MKDFRELKVWAKAHQMVLTWYKLTAGFPKHEIFGIVSQIRRFSSSIPANIAEGCGRIGNSELHRFLQIACGSANELENHFLLARDLGYLPHEDHERVHKQLLQMKRMLVALTRKVGTDWYASGFGQLLFAICQLLYLSAECYLFFHTGFRFSITARRPSCTSSRLISSLRYKFCDVFMASFNGRPIELPMTRLVTSSTGPLNSDMRANNDST